MFLAHRVSPVADGILKRLFFPFTSLKTIPPVPVADHLTNLFQRSRDWALISELPVDISGATGSLALPTIFIRSALLARNQRIMKGSKHPKHEMNSDPPLVIFSETGASH